MNPTDKAYAERRTTPPPEPTDDDDTLVVWITGALAVLSVALTALWIVSLI